MTEPSTDIHEPPRGRALRAGLIAAAVLGVALAIAVVVLASGDPDTTARPAAAAADPADPACLNAWNADPAQTKLGGHEAADHQVTRTWVLILGFDGQTPSDPAQGDCAVVFPTPEFGGLADDPTHIAQIKNGDAGWEPVRGLPAVTPQRLRELQAQAVKRANASLGEDGTLSPSSS